jgi:oligopeptide transport system substrate-binding protein
MPLLRICFPRPLLAAILLSLFQMLAQQATWASTVRRGLGPEPDSLNIHQAQGLTAINLLRDLREGLLTFDRRGEPAPGVAVKWEVLDEGLRYRFTLRDDARWSNGDPVTAPDFVRAWRRALSPSSAAATAGLLMGLRNAEEVLGGSVKPDALGIKAIAPGVLEVTLNESAPWILEILAHPVSYPLHSSAVEDMRRAPVNGAYVLAEWTPHAMIRLEKNVHFHAASTVAVDVVEYHPIEEPAAELSRYRAGELDITETIPAGRFEWLQEHYAPDLRVHPYLGSFWLGMNFRDRRLGGSVRLRRALALAIDRETLARVVLGAGEMPATSIVPPGISNYQPAAMPMSASSQAEREAEAVRLLKASGLAADEPLLLELRYNTSGLHRRVAIAVSAMWKQVLGVNTELLNEEWKVFVNNRRMGVVTQVFRGGWIADYADPGSFLDLFLSGNALNTTFYSNQVFDSLMGQADAAQGADRMELLRQSETLLMEDMVVIPLYYYVSRHLVRPGISGFIDNIRDIHLSRHLDTETNQP